MGGSSALLKTENVNFPSLADSRWHRLDLIWGNGVNMSFLSVNAKYLNKNF